MSEKDPLTSNYRARREALGLTRRELETLSRVSEETIRKIEDGFTDARPSTFARVDQALHLAEQQAAAVMPPSTVRYSCRLFHRVSRRLVGSHIRRSLTIDAGDGPARSGQIGRESVQHLSRHGTLPAVVANLDDEQVAGAAAAANPELVAKAYALFEQFGLPTTGAECAAAATRAMVGAMFVGSVARDAVRTGLATPAVGKMVEGICARAVDSYLAIIVAEGD